MDEKGILVGTTESVCPECLQVVEAHKIAYGTKVYLEKTCPQHGFFSTLIWQGAPDYEGWFNPKLPSQPLVCATEENLGCPYDCGLCAAHRQHPCCVLLEITQSCNLRCPVCFAAAGEREQQDPSLEEIKDWYQMLLDSGGPFNIQLSGGEPTLREDLPEIISLGKSMGFTFIQLNTNGLRLADSASYAEELKKAGLDCVFLQFDGLQDATYALLRGKPLLKEKLQAIEHCRAAALGVVLVPTLARGVNEGEIGAILEFALQEMPTVRGVHFQPMSFFGRYQEEPQEERLTIPTVLQLIEEQTKGKMPLQAFKSATGENSYCSFHGSFMLEADGTLQALEEDGCCCQKPVAAEKAKQSQAFVAKCWSSPQEEKKAAESSLSAFNFASLDAFLEQREKYTLAVSGMVFQDAWTLDLERLKECYILVVSPEQKLIPFCAYNLTAKNGKSLYRGRTYAG